MFIDKAYTRLAIRINKKYPYMGEADIDWLIRSVLETKALIDRRPE